MGMTSNIVVARRAVRFNGVLLHTISVPKVALTCEMNREEGHHYP